MKRRFKRSEENIMYPSLILIDGGKTHIKYVRKVIDKLNIKDICLLTISKGIRRKPDMDIIHTEKGGELTLRNNSPIRLLLQEIRDETHRFSISKQRNKELKGASKSSLDSVPFIGVERKKALLRFFGSLSQISKAGTEDLIKVKGIGRKTAEILFNNLH